MPVTITLPSGLGYVGAALLANVVLLFGQSATVGRYRKRAGVVYPQPYAEKAEAQSSKDAHLFNCAQRAHQNTLEIMPIVLILTLVGGLQYPIVVAAGSGLFTLGRISFTRGYITGDPTKRVGGFTWVSYPGLLTLFGSAVLSVVNLIKADL